MFVIELSIFPYDMDKIKQWYSKIGIQGICTIVSLALSILSLKKSIQCNHSKRSKDEFIYSLVNPKFSKTNIPASFKSASNVVRLPKRKKIVKTNENISLLKSIKWILEDCSSILTHEMNKIIAKSMEQDELTDEKCISAMSYEFVSVYGSEKIQQADVELFCTIFSKSINLEYNGYVEFLIVLKLIDDVVFKAFEPKMMLLSLLLVTSDHKDEIDEKVLFKFIKRNNMEISKVLSSVTAVSISKCLIKVKEEDIYSAIEIIKAAIVRRSSRIRKINK